MSEPWSVLITAAVGAIATAAGAILTLIYKNRQQEEVSTVKNYKIVFDRQEKRIARLETLIDEQRGLIESVGRDHTVCQIQLAEVYGDLCLIHQTACRHAAALTELGHPPGDVPPLRQRPSHIAASPDTEFLARTVQHNMKLVEATKGSEPPAKEKKK